MTEGVRKDEILDERKVRSYCTRNTFMTDTMTNHSTAGGREADCAPLGVIICGYPGQAEMSDVQSPMLLPMAS